jgi:hypothetical protein
MCFYILNTQLHKSQLAGLYNVVTASGPCRGTEYNASP